MIRNRTESTVQTSLGKIRILWSKEAKLNRQWRWKLYLLFNQIRKELIKYESEMTGKDHKLHAEIERLEDYALCMRYSFVGNHSWYPPVHKSAVVKENLDTSGIKTLPHPPYCPGWLTVTLGWTQSPMNASWVDDLNVKRPLEVLYFSHATWL